MSGVTTKYGDINGAGNISAWLSQSGFGGTPEGALMYLSALELNQANSNIQNTLKSIESSAKLREYLTKRMAKLEELKQYVNNNGSGDPKEVNMAKLIQEKLGLPEFKPSLKVSFGNVNNLSAEIQKEFDAWKKANNYDQKLDNFVKEYGLTKDDITVDPQTGRMTVKTGAKLFGDKINVDDLDVEIKRLKSEADTADQSRQLQLTMTQTALNQKQQLITLMTNIIKKSHETKSAVLRNIA